MNESAVRELLEAISPVKVVDPTFEAGESKLVQVPNTHAIKSLEQFQPRPNRIKATPQLASTESFCAYLNRFKGEETSVYIDVDKGVFTGIIDHHGKEDPRWRDHTVSFAPKTSLEWRAWTELHEKWITQVDLAESVERLLHTIVEPEPNVVLQAALDFQSNENLVVGSAQNLDDGTVRFNFQKDNASSSVTFPHRISLAMPVFDNEPALRHEARIRYRVSNEGVLRFKFSFVLDPEKIHRDALLKLAETIEASTEDLPHYEGSCA